MSITEQEINCQRDALNDLSHGDNSLVMNYVNWNGCKLAIIFRKIICEFESDLNRVPTSDELIWIASEMLHFNIRTLY